MVSNTIIGKQAKSLNQVSPAWSPVFKFPLASNLCHKINNVQMVNVLCDDQNHNLEYAWSF